MVNEKNYFTFLKNWGTLIFWEEVMKKHSFIQNIEKLLVQVWEALSQNGDDKSTSFEKVTALRTDEIFDSIQLSR